jgi:hypothetical protein
VYSNICGGLTRPTGRPPSEPLNLPYFFQNEGIKSDSAFFSEQQSLL